MVVLLGLPGSGNLPSEAPDANDLPFLDVTIHSQLVTPTGCRQDYTSYEVEANGLDMDQPGQEHRVCHSCTTFHHRMDVTQYNVAAGRHG